MIPARDVAGARWAGVFQLTGSGVASHDDRGATCLADTVGEGAGADQRAEGEGKEEAR